MALFGSSRDISMFRKINRELLGDVITQQLAFYKYVLDKTKINMYGEASGGKFFEGPILLNALITVGDNTSPTSEFGVDFNWDIKVKQFFVGKDPDYPYATNPLNPGLDQFGYNVSVVCETHYIPADRVNIIKQRL